MKLGYKQTEAGVIPKDWSEKPIHQFATIKTGPFGTLLKASEYSEGDGVPLISVSEIREGFLRVNDGTPRVSETVTRRLPQYVLRSGDIVFGRKGAVERSALIRRQEDGWFLGSDGISIRPVQDCHDEYLAFQFQSARVRGWLIQNAIGTTMPSLNQEVLRNVVVPFPPTKAEQEAIAEALSDADVLIESLEQLLAKKRQVKQGAMQELLTGKKRLPGFEVKLGYKQTEVGLIPEDWRIQPIEQISTVGRGRVISHREIARSLNPRYPVYSSQTSNNGVMGHLDTFEFEGEYITWTTDGANAGTVFARNGRFNCTNVCGTIKLKSDNHLFVAKVLGKIAPRHVSRHLGNPKLMNDVMKRVKIPLPPTKAEQEAIATILSDMDVEIAALDAKLAKARRLKQGMMQELLTGRIRLV